MITHTFRYIDLLPTVAEHNEMLRLKELEEYYMLIENSYTPEDISDMLDEQYQEYLKLLAESDYDDDFRAEFEHARHPLDKF